MSFATSSITLFVLAALVLSSTGIAHAQNDPLDLQSGINRAERSAENAGLRTQADAGTILIGVINWVLGLAAILALGTVVWAGIMYILALGDEQRASQAKRVLTYAIVGLIVIGMSFVIVTTVLTFLGVRVQ